VLDNGRENILGPGAITIAARPAFLNEAECGEVIGKVQPGPFVLLTVRDSGPAMTPEIRSRLFHEPFFSTKSKHKGLGLAVMYGILQNCGGGFCFDRDSDGSSIRVYLPTASAAVANALPGRLAEPADARLLVVDDEPLVLESLCASLQQAGFQVQGASNGREGLGFFMQPDTTFDLVVSDVLMPEMSGFDMARQILQRDPHALFLFISSQVSQEELANDATLRRFTLLRKPFERSQLLNAIRAAQAPRAHAVEARDLTSLEKTRRKI
jgi:CheY-like chemotaxis protein